MSNTRKIKELAYKTFLRLLGLLPIKKNKVLFISYYGLSYSDNPAAISRWIEMNAPELDIVWAFQGDPPHPQKIRTVSTSSLRYIYELATAKVWVDNCRKRAWMVKRKGQRYMQTWHGGVPLKMVEKDVQEQLPDIYIRNAINDSKMIDVMLAECVWRADNYRKAFWYDGEIMCEGLPRSDVFYINHDSLQKSVRTYFNLPEDANIVLYAPTFRQDGNLDYLQFDYDVILQALNERFDGEWYLLLRLHPNNADKQDLVCYSEYVLNGSKYPDMNELLCGCQVLITDYSGCIFDAMHIGMPLLIYAPDLQRYTSEDRPLYFDITSLPAPYAETQNELLDNIRKFDYKKYIEETNTFNENLGYCGDGHATEEAAKKVLRFIYENE